MIIHVILFPEFETLDVFGPVEVLGKIEGCRIGYYSQDGGLVENSDGVKIDTFPIEAMQHDPNRVNVLLIPGGMGTRTEIDNRWFIEKLKRLAFISRYVLTVCTGSALLAKTGLLDGRKATSNKRSLKWVESVSDQVYWIKQARWVVDDKYYTSSGISAGIDMTLGFISDIFGMEKAEEIAFRIEYNWQKDNTIDNFWK